MMKAIKNQIILFNKDIEKMRNQAQLEVELENSTQSKNSWKSLQNTVDQMKEYQSQGISRKIK